MSLTPEKRPHGWQWTHEWQAKLIARDGLMCETHPGLDWPHDDCSGPGAPWLIEGKADILEVRALEAKP